MTVNATITFSLGSAPVKFTLHSTEQGREWDWPRPDQSEFTGTTWRLLASDCAIELWPICGDEAQLTDDQPPPFDRLEIHPVAWGYPDSLLKDHPAEVEQWRQDHRAGKCDIGNRRLPWCKFLDQIVKPDLWRRFATEELARYWLNKLDGPGQPLFVFAGTTFGGDTARIPKSILPEIKLRAEFYQGDTCQTIYLHKCAKGNLTDEELRNSPTHIARLEALASQQMQASASNAQAAAKFRKSRRPGGKATSAWKGIEHEAAELARLIRQKEAAWKADPQKRPKGATSSAIAWGRQWWAKKYKDTIHAHSLDESAVSYSTIYRLMRSDLRGKRSSLP